jgi:uncharacterized protein (UPF0332 family)
VKPETTKFVEFARDMLRRASQMSSIHLYDDAGRAAYLTCFHVAQAVIFERGRVKTFLPDAYHATAAFSTGHEQ